MSATTKRRARRRSSRGSIVLKEPGRWLVRVDYGQALSGRRIRRGVVVHGTKDDAERQLTTMLKEQDDHPDLKPSSDTVAAWVAYYFEHLTRDLAPRTVATYRYAWTRYIEGSPLAEMPLTRLSAKASQAWINGLSKRLGPTTVHMVARMFRAILGQAVAMGELARNPMAAKGGVRLPRLAPAKRPRLTLKEARAFLTAAKEDRFAALWIVWLETALRPSEILALKWSDLNGDVLTVQRSLIRLGKEWMLDRTKTGTVRRITLSKGARAAVKKHRAQQAQEKLALGPYWQEHDLMFPALGGMPMTLANLDRRHFKPVLKAAKLSPMPLYSMRHTSATLLLKSGATVKDVQDRLGHARSDLTLDLYVESDTESQRAATSQLAAVLAG